MPERGILWHLHEKSPQLPLVGSIFRASAEHPFSSVMPLCQRANKLQTAIIRIKKISPYDTERQTYQKSELHIITSSYRIKKAAKVVGLAITAIVGLLFWGILKPIFRGVGWLISILTAIGIIYWITTL